jgi:DNA-binding transcriptional LysR family regulator
MKDAQLRRLDLGLLLVLSETLRHRRLTLVAARLGQTQSGISHALGRLRQIFDDPLFLRRPHGLEPTARALALEPAVNAMLALAREAVAGAAFDPAIVEGEVRIAAQDYHCGLFAAPLIARCEAEAPGLRPVFLPLTRRRALDALETGEADLVIGFIARPGDRFASTALLEQDYAVAARADHPRLDRLSDLNAYAAERHLLISQDGERVGVVDGVLSQLGRRREVVAALPYALAALATIAATDLIATVPRRLAERFGPTFGLAVVDPPLAIRRFTVSLIRRKRDVGSGRLDWVEAALKAAA